jgi:hypothetical protein
MKHMPNLCLSSAVLSCFSLKILSKLNSAIFPLLLVKIDSGTPIKMLPLLSFIFRWIKLYFPLSGNTVARGKLHMHAQVSLARSISGSGTCAVLSRPSGRGGWDACCIPPPLLQQSVYAVQYMYM